MKKYIHLSVLIIFIQFASCAKTNKFDDKGLKTGSWIEYSDSLVEKGIYKEGKRFGVWKKYLGNTLNEEIEYIQDKDIDIKTTKYFCNNKLYLTEKSLNDQIINVTVSEKLCYSEYFEKFKARISSDLFLYHCINCHNPLANEDETKFIKETDSMIAFLKSPRHIKVDTASASLNIFEVEAISNYILNRF